MNRAGADRAAAPTGPARVLAWAVAAFIVYGSLFPFAFQTPPQPFSKLLADWNPLASISDAVDNVLLFVPLGAALHARGGPAGLDGSCSPRPCDRWTSAGRHPSE